VTPSPLVLVVEDSMQNYLLVEKVLVRGGYRVQHAGDGAAGVRAAETEAPDLVLLDLHLPVLDGFEAFRQLRTMPALADVPIVAVTADVIRGDRERVLEAGFDGYLAKPFHIDELVELVRELCPVAG